MQHLESGTVVIPHIKTGKLRVIAVGSKRRSLALPDVLTIAEAG
ncbi:MAG: tripartite tricarboxylate transporter substrate binding protein, partial [Alcaligenaceae bacterium]